MRVLFRAIAAVTVLAVAIIPGYGASFREVPAIIGAYTLRGGEWQIGADLNVGLATLPDGITVDAYGPSVTYGVTDWFQVGIGYCVSLQAEQSRIYAFSAKLRLPLGPGLDLGLPFAAAFQDRGFGREFGYLQSGAVVSAKIGAGPTVHGSAALGFGRDQGFYFQPHVIVDFDLLPNLKLVGELGLIPVSVALGT